MEEVPVGGGAVGVGCRPKKGGLKPLLLVLGYSPHIGLVVASSPRTAWAGIGSAGVPRRCSSVAWAACLSRRPPSPSALGPG